MQNPPTKQRECCHEGEWKKGLNASLSTVQQGFARDGGRDDTGTGDLGGGPQDRGQQEGEFHFGANLNRGISCETETSFKKNQNKILAHLVL